MTNELQYIINNIKYQEFPELINSEIKLKLDDLNDVNNSIKEFIYEKLKLNVPIKVRTGQIAKLGLIDLTIELDSEIDSSSLNGLDILKINKLIDDKSDEVDFEEIFKGQIENNKTYLKLFLSVKGITRRNWFRENKNEFFEYTKTGIYTPKKEN